MWIKVLLCMLLLIASTNQAIPQQRTNKTVVQKKRQQTTQKIKQNTKLLEQNKAETAKRLKELSVLEANIIELNKDIDINQTSSDSLVALIKNITDTIGDYESRISNLTSKYSAALKHQQGNFRSVSTLNFLFASKNVSEAVRKYRALKSFSKWRERKASEIENLKVLVQQRKDTLENYNKKLINQSKKLQSQKLELENAQKQNEDLIKTLSRKEKEIKNILAEQQKELNKLDAQLEKIIAQEQKEAKIAEQKRLEEEKKQASDNKQTVSGNNQREEHKHENSKSRSSNISDLTNGFQASKGRLPYPVDGKHVVIRGFGRQKHPNLPMIETDNPGIDISVEKDALARSVYEGTVSAIFKQPGYNNVVMIRHGNYLTIYANLSTVTVAKGEKIQAGQPLGKIAVDEDDAKGRSIIHFEIRHEKDKENPSAWIH